MDKFVLLWTEMNTNADDILLFKEFGSEDDALVFYARLATTGVSHLRLFRGTELQVAIEAKVVS